MTKKILISVAWPYVNGDLHVGHLAGYLIPADIMARFQRLYGNDVLMVSGSDCYGTPITVQADKEKKTPQEVVDEYHKKDLALFKKYNLSYNLYTKTATSEHGEIVQEEFLELLKNGFIIKKKENQYYSKTEDQFLPDRYVEGECPHCHAKEQRSDQCENCGRMIEMGAIINPYSKLTKSPVTMKETEHYYIDLSSLNKDIERYIESKKGIWKNWVFQEALGWSKEGLKPRAITRDLDWGVEIPHDRISEDMRLERPEGKKFYVWFDAVTGYYSASKIWSKIAKGELTQEDIIFNKFENQSIDWEEWWNKEKNSKAFHYYFMGQDNVVFHTIMWPAQLIGAFGKDNIHTPDNVAANKFMNYEGKKFSKSRGWIIDSNEIADEYGVDAVRYYVAANLPENKEGNFTWEEFHAAINNELVANLGNLINRTLVFATKSFGGKIAGKLEDVDLEIKSKIEEIFRTSAENIDKARIVEGLRNIMELSAFGNKYFNDKKIWEVIKKDEDEARKIMFNLLQIISALRFMISPFMPTSADKLSKMIGSEEIINVVGEDNWKFALNEEFSIQEVETLFKKVDPEVQKSKIKSPEDQELKWTIEKVKELIEPIRVVKVLEIEKHPDADKLLVTKVTDGRSEYQVVTGASNIKVGDLVPYLGVGQIVPGYLIAKKEKMVLKKKPLRGVESEGMILAEDEIGISDKHEEIYIIDTTEEYIGKSILEILQDAQLKNLVN